MCPVRYLSGHQTPCNMFPHFSSSTFDVHFLILDKRLYEDFAFQIPFAVYYKFACSAEEQNKDFVLLF